MHEGIEIEKESGSPQRAAIIQTLDQIKSP